MLSSVLYSLRLEGGGNVTEASLLLDLIVLILISFNYLWSVAASGRGVIGHLTRFLHQ